jgi:hypothetical protein
MRAVYPTPNRERIVKILCITAYLQVLQLLDVQVAHPALFELNSVPVVAKLKDDISLFTFLEPQLGQLTSSKEFLANTSNLSSQSKHL